MAQRKSTTRGFQRTASVLHEPIRRAGESRGFAVSRLLTHWSDIAGDDVASIARPVSVTYGRGGFGATLVLLTTGAQAPMLEMQKEKIREKVNAVYGYNAISKVRITQTAANGFEEGKAQFDHQKQTIPTEPDPEIKAAAIETVRPIENNDLRQALERLGRNVLSKSKQ